MKGKGYIIILIVFSAVLYSLQYLSGANNKNSIQRSLSGRIVSVAEESRFNWVKTSNIAIRIKLNNTKDKIVILPQLNAENSPPAFLEFAKIGDSLFKDVNSDWIYIVRNGQRFRWHIPL